MATTAPGRSWPSWSARKGRPPGKTLARFEFDSVQLDGEGDPLSTSRSPGQRVVPNQKRASLSWQAGDRTISEPVELKDQRRRCRRLDRDRATLQAAGLAVGWDLEGGSANRPRRVPAGRLQAALLRQASRTISLIRLPSAPSRSTRPRWARRPDVWMGHNAMVAVPQSLARPASTMPVGARGRAQGRHLQRIARGGR